jgi:ADP-heptose:LPS heptosyltransferase
VERILLVMADRHFGNLVVASPVMAGIVQGLGENLLGLVVDSRLLPLVERVPGLAGVRIIPYRDRSARSSWDRVRQFWVLQRSLRLLRPSLALDLEGNQAGALLGWLSGAPERVGPESCRRASLYTTALAVKRQGHRVEQYAQLAHWLGIDVADLRPRLQPTAEDYVQWRAYAESVRLSPKRPFACLHVGGGRDLKCWPEQHFAELTLRLARLGVRAVLVGGRPDLEKAARVASAGSRYTVNAVDRLPIGALLVGLSRCAVFIGNDSGPAHLAAAVGAPVTVLFGPTAASEWAPLGPSVSVLRGRVPLDRELAARWAKDARSMESIPVWAVARTALRQVREAGRCGPWLDPGAEHDMSRRDDPKALSEPVNA